MGNPLTWQPCATEHWIIIIIIIVCFSRALSLSPWLSLLHHHFVCV